MKKTLRAIVLIMAGLLVLAALTSCGKTINSIEKKATDAGFECEEVSETMLASMNTALPIMGIDGEIKAAIEIGGEVDGESVWAEVYEFDSASAAKTFVEKFETLVGSIDEDEALERSGKVVISGDKAIVEKVW